MDVIEPSNPESIFFARNSNVIIINSTLALPIFDILGVQHWYIIESSEGTQKQEKLNDMKCIHRFPYEKDLEEFSIARWISALRQRIYRDKISSASCRNIWITSD